MSTDTAVQVAIVGAGMSGLRAAKEVHDAGLSYIVLEAMDRVGGKVLSTPTKDNGGSPVEEGAAWINDTSQFEMHALAKEYGFGLVKQRAEGNSFYQAEDGKISLIPFELAMLLTPEELQEVNRVMEVFTKYIDRSDLDSPHLGPDASELDAMSALEFCNREFGKNPIAHKLMANLAAGLVGAEPREMSALYLFDYVKSGTGLQNMSSDRKHGGQYLRNRAGNQQFAERLAGSLKPDSIRLSTPIKSIAQEVDGCIIRTGSSVRSVVKADRVIVTVPSPLYHLIDFQPKLPPAKAKLASATHLGYYSKTILVFSSPWWRPAGLSGILGSATAVGVGPISFSRDTSVPEDDQYTITCFHVGDKGREWSKLDPAARRAAVLQQFCAAFSSVVGEGAVPDPVKIIEKEWSKDPWTRGGPATVMGPGIMTSEAGKAIRDPVGRVHFAGTETAFVWKGYMEGAVRSGIRAAREVIEALA
ncbi:hypothetical protein ACJ41O_006559 [Fusarium nematophilum]